MSSEEALREFLANPRLFLLPPQPRAPCKLSIQGPSYAGKTTLCRALANKYNAAVIQMDELIRPEMAKSKEMLVEKAKKTATEDTIEVVKSKFREKLEQDRGNDLFYLLFM